MKVILLKPNMPAKIIEVSSIQEINVLIHNINKDGTGYDHVGSEIRMDIGHNVDLYCNENAINNFDFEQNIWAPGDNAVLFGEIVFAGYDPNSRENWGACSLSNEQIEYTLAFIGMQR